MIRQIHRWVSFPLIIFLFLVTATGVVLQLQETGEVFEGERPTPTASALPTDAELLAQVQKALIAARVVKADFPAQRLELDFSRGDAKARFAMSPRGGPAITVDMKSGKAEMVAAPKPNLHVTMIQLHTGKMFGPVGLIIVMLVSIIFLVLTVTGFIVYLDMWKRRRAANKTGLFWK
jgi:uncharacterized iron-regulated membrane protein